MLTAAAVRFAGAAAVALALWGAGNGYAGKIERKIAAEDGFLMLLSHIKTMILASGAPLDKIYASFHPDIDCMAAFLAELQSGSCGALRTALANCGKELFRDEAFLFYAKAFSEEIGAARSARDGVLLCEKYHTLCADATKRSREKDRTSAALSKKLGAVAAAFALVLLL